MSSAPESPSAPHSEEVIIDRHLRAEALDRAVAAQRGAESSGEIVARAHDFLGFLNGERPAPTSNIPGADLDVLEQLVGFIRRRTFEDSSGLRSLQGRDAQEEAASYLVDLTGDQLRVLAHLVATTRAVVTREINRRSQGQ